MCQSFQSFHNINFHQTCPKNHTYELHVYIILQIWTQKWRWMEDDLPFQIGINSSVFHPKSSLPSILPSRDSISLMSEALLLRYLWLRGTTGGPTFQWEKTTPRAFDVQQENGGAILLWVFSYCFPDWASPTFEENTEKTVLEAGWMWACSGSTAYQCLWDYTIRQRCLVHVWYFTWHRYIRYRYKI